MFEWAAIILLCLNCLGGMLLACVGILVYEIITGRRNRAGERVQPPERDRGESSSSLFDDVINDLKQRGDSDGE